MPASPADTGPVEVYQASDRLGRLAAPDPTATPRRAAGPPSGRPPWRDVATFLDTTRHPPTRRETRRRPASPATCRDLSRLTPRLTGSPSSDILRRTCSRRHAGGTF